MKSATTRRGAILVAVAVLAAATSTACSSSKETLPAVQRLDLTPPAPSLPKGATVQLRATALWNTGAPQDVGPTATWTSSNPAVATVAGGLVTGVAPGGATVTATWSGQSAAVAVTVTPAALVAISVDPPVAALPAGTRRDFTATGTYSDGTTRDLTGSAAWSSSSAAVVALPVGEVRAVSAGAATVTASHDGRQATAAVTVTAPALVELRVAPWEASVPAGLTTAFTATGVYSDGSTADLTPEVLWAAEGDLAFFPGGAPAGTARGLTVGGPGLVRALLPGSAVAGQASLTVTDAVPLSIDVTPGAATLAAGLTRAFLASAVFSDGHHADVTSQATWSSSAPLVAAVSTAPATAGQVSALAAGQPVTITATLAGTGVSGSATLTVAAAAVAAIDVAPAVATVAAGRTQAFTAEAVLTDGRRLPATDDATWSSSDPGLAPVSNAAGSRGTATGLRAGGPVTIAASLPGVALTGAAALTVAPAALTGLVVEPASLSLAAGTGGRLLATGLFSDGTRADLTGAVTWTSATPTGVSVGTGLAGAGVVSAILPGGPVTVTAALPGGGPTASAEVTVTPAVLTRLELTPASASVALGRSAAFHATGVFSDGARQDLTAQVSWLSSDVAVATVSNALASAGVAQSRGEGTAELMAWFPGTAVTAAATLTVTPPEVLAIAVAPATATIPAGRLQRFTAAGTYTDGVVRDVTAAATWSSSAPAVAALTAVAGEVRGLAAGGPVTVGAALGGVSGSAALTVGPPVLEAVVVSPAAVAVRFGESVNLTARGTWSDGSSRDVTAEATWSSAPAGVVVLQLVDGMEQVTGRALGDAAVLATLDGVSGEAAVAVQPVLPDRIDVTPAVAQVALGGQLQLRAFASYPGGAVVEVTGAATWTAADPSVLLAGPLPGQFTALVAGATTVTATLGPSGSASVTVTDQPFTPALVALRIDGTTPSLGVGGVAQLTATAIAQDGAAQDVTGEVTWSSATPAVATVDAAGLARGVAAGVSTVTASHAASGLSASAPLEVRGDATVTTLAVRIPPRVVAGATIRASAVGLLAGGGELDLSGAVQWIALNGASAVGQGLFAFQGSVGRIAAVWLDQVAVAEVTVLGPQDAVSYRLLPGDATLAPADPIRFMSGLEGLATFVAVLSFEDAVPSELVSGACTDDGPQVVDCANAFVMGDVAPGCELTCLGGNGTSVCLPTAPTTRAITCTAGPWSASATATVSAAPHTPAAAGLFVRPAGWAAGAAQQLIDPNGNQVFDFQAPPLPSLHGGELANLEAVAFYDDATFAPTAAAWSSADQRVAAVEGPGQLRAGLPGTAAIQAEAHALIARATFDVLPDAAGMAFTLQGPQRLEVGGEPANFQASALGGADLTASLSWRSSDPAVASFDPAIPGRLMANAPGAVTVTASSRQGHSASQEVVVVGVVGLEIYPRHPRVNLGSTFPPVAVARMSDGQLVPVVTQVAWLLGTAGVLFEGEPGLFTAEGIGTTTLTGSWAGLSDTVTIEVGAGFVPALDSILVPPIPPLAVGQVVVPQAFAIRDDGFGAAIGPDFTYAVADAAVAAPAPGDPTAILGVGPGTTTWTITDPTGTVSGSAPVEVYQLASISISPATLSLAAGELAQVRVTGVDTLGQRHALPGAPVVSADPAVVRVEDAANGVLRALAEGSTTVSASWGGVNGSATVAVGPAAPVQLWLEPRPLVLELGTSQPLRALVELTDGSIVDVTPQAAMRSLDPSVVTLAGNVVEAVGLGEGPVFATFAAAGRTVSAVARVLVIPVVTNLQVLVQDNRVPVGATVQVVAGVLLPGTGPVDLSAAVTWSTAPAGRLAPVPGSPGVFTALAEGQVTVTATTASGASASADVFVVAAAPVSMVITPNPATGVVGQETAFTAMATLTDGTTRDVTLEASWGAAGPADVVAPGVFRPTRGGTIVVQAFIFSVAGEAFAEATMEVPHVLLALFPQQMGQAFQGEVSLFRVDGLRDDGQSLDVTADVTWSVDRPDATVGPTPGEITFLGAGLYTVTVTAPGGTAVAELRLEVFPVPVSLAVSPAVASVDQDRLLHFTAEVTFSDGTVLEVSGHFSTSWSAVDGLVAKHFGLGDFLGAQPGTTEVVATWTDGFHQVEGRASLTVVAVPTSPPRVEPFHQAIQVGGTAAYTVVQDMSDGSLRDLTAEAAWSVDVGSPVARSEGGGVFTGLEVGSTIVVATLPGAAGSAGGSLDVLP